MIPPTVVLVLRRHQAAGLIVTDLWLVDEGLEISLPEGTMFATRYYTPEGFAMTAGVGMPVDLALLKSALKSVPQLQRRSHAEAIDDRRFGKRSIGPRLPTGSWKGLPTKTRSAPAVQPYRVSRKRRHSASISYSVVARHGRRRWAATGRCPTGRPTGIRTTQAGARNGFGEPRDRAPKTPISRPPGAAETARPSFDPQKGSNLGPIRQTLVNSQSAPRAGLREDRKNANIHASLEVIRGISG